MAYISLLSNIGENLAARLRTSLFSSLLRQDIEFFDRHKTGELIDRLGQRKSMSSVRIQNLVTLKFTKMTFCQRGNTKHMAHI